ncbi:MAG: 16S rRNA (guanine(966)-N(2))-methyltransferase RsmD [Gammaproteobacteria bacterium]|uniref:Ribosomal RNA small subunit methyltransferase D n=1 Tax=Candidatus Thiopontia autotrophica TaxID=2841688 RepID=A0A8J6PBW0_9GAMM|nr:16S rRNA (guanine(966)-N(2))-methyltransferase RsmD [Candidatus Thiopontia autotrophica]MBL6969384.1 16S rRNA (guanine(966)-N(2))-methyltransferase RsmD [Gammaproteobacteria bacterium]
MVKKGKSRGGRRLRIVAGEWRGRTLSFPDNPGIRPTPDRVRETLFNWLQPTISGALCLDLFAGSGALGLEALSRGASHVDFVEFEQKSAQAIGEHLELLKSDRGEVFREDAFIFLEKRELSPYSLIFLDPPFNRDMLEKVFILLERSELSPKLQLYIETEQGVDELEIPSDWVVARKGKAGQVRYMLLESKGREES